MGIGLAAPARLLPPPWPAQNPHVLLPLPAFFFTSRTATATIFLATWASGSARAAGDAARRRWARPCHRRWGMPAVSARGTVLLRREPASQRGRARSTGRPVAGGARTCPPGEMPPSRRSRGR
ncbi:hypothetical protein ACP70R_019988 [Stipagrostis hirtigluma subsp. patula]